MTTKIKLPKDAEGREVPLDVEILYDTNGEKVNITSFTFNYNVYSHWANWEVFSPDDGILPVSGLYLIPPQGDNWNKLFDDLNRARTVKNDKAFCSVACAYMNKSKDECNDCDFFCDYKDCYVQMIENIVSRITNLRNEN